MIALINTLHEPAAAATMSPHASYTYKASLIGSAQRFELTNDGLSWVVGGKSGVWAYGDIAGIRLSYRPVTMQSRRFRADIDHVNGQRVTILSTSWQTVALIVPQDIDYRAFITQLHQRLVAAGSRAVLSGGDRPAVHLAGIVFMALAAIALAGLLARAVATGQFAGAMFLIGFAGVFAWQIGGFVRRNKPRRYSFDELPTELLP